MEVSRKIWHLAAGSVITAAVLAAGSSVRAQCVFDVSDKIIAWHNGQPDGEQDDRYGHSVAIHGDIAVVGVYRDDDGGSESGSAHVYHYENSTWVWKQKLTASDAAAIAQFGYSVAIDDGIILVGARWRDNGQQDYPGAAYVFRYIGSTWVETAILETPEVTEAEEFGAAVAIQGNLAVVGAPDGSINGTTLNGYAVVFQYTRGEWEASPKLFDPAWAGGVDFGSSVAIDGDVIVVGDHGDDGGGRGAFIYRLPISNPPVPEKSFYGDYGALGFSVAVSGDNVVLGDESADAAYAFHYDEAQSIWNGPHLLVGHDADDDSFGCSVAAEGDRIVVGARYAEEGGIASGAVYCFAYCGLDGDEVYKLISDDAADYDELGASVALSGDFLIMGAPFDDDHGTDSGSAYIFDYAGTGLTDTDGDGIPDDCDNCPQHPNPCQADCDDDGEGDVCEIAWGAEDCNDNGIPDQCDIDWGFSEDCNNNGIPDECDVTDPELDCDQDGVVDECQVVPVVDLVFLLDCSGSMDDADDLCPIFLQEIEELRSAGTQLNVWFLGINSVPNSQDYACLMDSGEYYSSVVNVFGVNVPDIPGDPPISPPGCCAVINQEEDWRPGLAIIGGLMDWRDGLKVIVPVSDEAPSDGDDCDGDPGEDDYETTVFARDMAAYFDVVMFPVLGKDPDPDNKSCILGLMQLLVADNPGQVIDCSAGTSNMNQLAELILPLTFPNGDCNDNGTPDVCDLMEGGGSYDCNENSIPDECECLHDLYIDGEGKINIDELFYILSHWGSCPDPGEGFYCPGDSNCDGKIDIDDLFYILNHWGTCEQADPGGAPQSIYDCILRYSSDPEDLEACIEAIMLTNPGGQ